MLSLILLIIAVILFLVAATGYRVGKVSLLALGLASLAGALIASHFAA